MKGDMSNNKQTENVGDIQITNLSKIFKTDEREVVAIKNFNLDIKKGELVSIVGPSGCGKTTLLRCIAGLETPTSGVISSHGKQFTKPGADRGMVFQDFMLFPWRSVRKNVEFGLEVMGLAKTERRIKAETYLKLVGLEKFMDAKIHELSGGMKQRIGIARALVTKPSIILMDEPFGALDAQTRNIMQSELVKILDKTDQTIIFVTHSVEEAIFLSDRIIVLTKRPATIKEIINVPWSRPRDRTNSEFIALRRKILKNLEEENVMSD
ncbi:MAG: ABC transporter ATP-binding protein [archaeon]|nr:ABC transporter ATP-binding protein [archaeon]